MKNELQIFSYEGNEIRTVRCGGEPWWVLKDVCEVLGIANSRDASARLDDDEKDGVVITDPLGRPQNTTVISESGLYNIILLSRKPEAKKFKRWVTHEVLPSIRKHGLYAADELLANPDLFIRALEQLKLERAEKKLLRLVAELNMPKVLFADAVSASTTDILIGELAKILKGNGFDIGQKRLFEKLRENGFLIKRQGSDYNTPTQRAMELGLFRIKETAITHSDGHITVNKTPKVTGKGQIYFVNLFLKNHLANANKERK